MLINPESIRGWPYGLAAARPSCGGQDAVLQTGAIEQRSKHPFGFEKFSRNLARHARVMAIIGINFADRFGDFRKSAKTKESALAAINLREPAFLRDHGPSDGQLTRAALTAPAGPSAHIL